MRTGHTVTIAVNVDDPQALWAAAYAQARQNSMTQDDIADWLGTQVSPNVPNCLRQMFDPGISPPGTVIQDSSADEGIDLD